MALKGRYQLPWAPVTGDIAPLWNTVTAEGARIHSDSAPGRAQLLCCFSWANPAAANALLDELAARGAEIERLGCSLRVFMPQIPPVQVSRPFPLLRDAKARLAGALALPLARRGRDEASPHAVLINADNRVVQSMPLELSAAGAEAVLSMVRRHSPFASMRPLHPPVLHLPRLLPPNVCRSLIEAFRSGDTYPGAVVQSREGRVVRVVEPEKKVRRDFRPPKAMRDSIWRHLQWRMVPAVRKAFHFDITQYEYLQVGRYTAEEGGRFTPHRDNHSLGDAHRRFALTLNLNDDYEGGELRLLEYGANYKLATGDALVFSCSMLHEALRVTQGERFVLVGMFWGDAEAPLFERSRALRIDAPQPKPETSETSARHAVEGARMLREIAGDLTAFGGWLETEEAATARSMLRLHASPLEFGERVNDIRLRLQHLRNDLIALRAPYMESQMEKLAPPAGPAGLQLHLGCGGHLLAGWVNVDVSRGDLRMDLRWQLPFSDGSVRYVFAAHVIEHVFRRGELPRLLEEIRRVLQPGGVLRVVVPDIEKCLRAYVAGDAQFFAERSKTWKWAADCKTPLDHFLAYAGANQAIESFGGHKYGYDFATLSLALSEAGFSQIERSEFMQSPHDALRIDRESRNAAANADGVFYSLFVEATR